MDKFRYSIAHIHTHLKNLTPSQKLLIGSLAVIVAMSMFLVVQYSGRGGMVELMADDPQQQVVSTLRAAGFDVETKDGKVMIPPAERSAAIAQLSQSGALPSDSEVLFGDLIGMQDWRNSASKDRQQYIFALQNELARVISQFRDVRAAKVIINAPENVGLGRAARPPTASVSIFSDSGGAISQQTVDAAARLVAGSQSGLEVKNVSVVDGSTGRPRKPTDEGEMLSSSYLEHQALVERETREKLEGLLSYIPGAIIAVTAQVDVTKVNSQIQKNLPKGEGTVSLPARTETMTLTQTGGSRGAEPGVRSNAAMDINQGATSTGSKVEQEETTEEFDSAIGTEITQLVDPRGMPTSLVASVNVPEGYVERLIRRESGAADADAADAKPIPAADLQARFDAVKAQIIETVRPHLRLHADDGTPIDGEVQVAMVPIDFEPAPDVGEAGILGVLGGGGIAVGGGMIDKVVLGALAAVAVGMMLMMVRRSSKRIELPSPAELVGVPPSLAMDADVIGEVAEGGSPLLGIEVEDDEVRVQNMLEQVADLVDKNPDGAANLLRRWIQLED
jgi:flagellar biosynthesis/type III secretory pathway M-ring protein FliF/YscJ